MGTSGYSARDDALSVITALHSIGCGVVVFGISCDEISRNLKTMIREERPNRFGRTHSAMVRGEVTEDYVRLVIADPETALKKIGVAVRQLGLSDYEGQHRFFDKSMYDEFIAGIHWKSLDARAHDADCVAYIMRLRNGQHRRDPLDCKYVFGTGNSRLAHFSRKFCLENRLIDERHCGPVINQQDLAAIAWLRTGFEGVASLPRKHMLAACEKVLRLQKSMVERVQSELSKVNPARIDELQLLLLDQRSVTRLMDSTLGTPDRVKENNVEQLLDEMVRATAEQIENEYKEKLKDEADKGKGLKKEIAAKNERLIQLEAELKETRSSEYQQFKQIVARVNSNVRFINRFIIAIIFVVSAAALMSEATPGLASFPKLKTAFAWAGGIFAVIGAYYTIADMIGFKKFGLRAISAALAQKLLLRAVVRGGVASSSLNEKIANEAGVLILQSPD